MIPRTGLRIAATTLALGAGAAISAQVPASASTFTATYSCGIPNLGTETVTVGSTLTASPNPAAAASPVSFDLSVASLDLMSPVAVNSWSASADIAGSGAESSTFQITGSGGYIPPGQPITNSNLTGRWTPAVSGTDEFKVGTITITVNTDLFGHTSATCTPSGAQPVAETLTVG
jgi:hypothetical protein